MKQVKLWVSRFGCVARFTDSPIQQRQSVKMMENNLDHIILRWEDAMKSPQITWEIHESLIDIPRLCAEVNRLRKELRESEIHREFLLEAARATEDALERQRDL